jgi:hypothetical protein
VVDAWRKNQDLSSQSSTGLVFGQAICLPDGTPLPSLGNGNGSLISSGLSSGFVTPSLSGLRASGNGL